MTPEQIGWIGDGIALFAGWRLTGGHRDCFLIFMVSVCFLIMPVIHAHVWNQVGLFICYFFIDLIGYFRWNKVKKS